MTAKTRTTKTTKAATCQVADCPREPAMGGLCTPHYDTHRGLAKEETR
ncbi:hypothetical protein [Micromonospora globbae]|nr:hypothetical protein [Micromonospora globbae]